ncbi:MAG: hypothetical protein R6X08_09140 [Desulfosalsimonadaceae bacterium]
MRTRKPRIVFCLLLAAALAAACAAQICAQTGEDPFAPQQLADKEKERMSGVHLFDMRPQKARFRIIHGKDEGERVAMRLEPFSDSGNKWRLAFSGLYRLSLTKAPEGAVKVQQLKICRKDRKINFSPSFPLLPAQLVAGEKTRTSGTIKITGPDNGSETKSGKYTHVVKSLSRTKLDTPAGPRTGYLLEYTCSIELPYSSIRIDLEAGFDIDKRLAYWREQTTIEKLGLFSKTSFRTLAVTGEKSEDKPAPPFKENADREIIQE